MTELSVGETEGSYRFGELVDLLANIHATVQLELPCVTNHQINGLADSSVLWLIEVVL
jgi:hypothetical protein